MESQTKQFTYGELKLILKNIRRLQSKAWNKRNSNWVIVKEVFPSYGRTSSIHFCELIGIDPDSHHIG